MSRVALVTGGSRGIGRAITERLARDGFLVAVHHSPAADAAAHAPDAAADTIHAVTSHGGEAFPVAAEFGESGDVDLLFGGIHAGLMSHGADAAIDVVVNNAAELERVSTAKITPEIFDRMMAVNARAPFFIIQRCLNMIPEGGRVINISSGLTRTTEPSADPQETMHAMSKAALEMLTLHFARPLGSRGVTINTVAPGVVDTGDKGLLNPDVRDTLMNLSAFRRLGFPVDVADIVAFLASQESRWITGSWVDATGGTLV